MMNEMKKNWRLTVLAAMASAVIGLVGCGGAASDEAGTSPNLDGDAANVSLGVKLQSVAPTAAVAAQVKDATVEAVDADQGLISISSARVVVGEIELKLPENSECNGLRFHLDDFVCDTITAEDPVAAALAVASKSSDGEEGEAEEEQEQEQEGGSEGEEQEREREREREHSGEEHHLSIEGPFVIDMLTGTSQPTLSDLQMPSGLYKEIEIKIEKLDEDSTLLEAGDLLLGHSMVIEGVYTAADVEKMFRLILDVDEEIEFENDAGIQVDESSDVNEVIVSIDVASWFSSANLGACLDSGTPEIDEAGYYVITEDTEGDACQFIDELKDGIKASGEFDEEDDGDDDEAESDEEDSGQEDDAEESA